MINKGRKQWWKVSIMVVVVAICVSLVGAVTYAEDTVQTLSEHIIRLHIVANSDTDIDQEVKLKVRDAVLEYLSDKVDLKNSTEETASIIKEELQNLQKIAATVLEQNGHVGKAVAEFGLFPFPTKEYDAITLPAGTYNALRITLGEGVGQNWWCVVFPPLCFADSQNGTMRAETDDKLKETLPAEQYDLITTTDQDTLPVKFKFKVVEVVEETKHTISKWWDSIFS